jgi:hypothetical protein
MSVPGNTFDVAIIGGGPAGFGAALGAASHGARTVAVEKHPALGGMGTSGLVNNFCCAHNDGVRLIIGGVFARLRGRLLARGKLYEHRYAEPYDPAAFEEETRAMCAEAGVTLLLGQTVTGADFPARAPAVFRLADGTEITARTVVDATGDATVAARAGVPFTFGRPSDHAVMPLTYCYKMGPMDLEQLAATYPHGVRTDPRTGERFVWLSPGLKDEVQAAHAAGDLSIPRDCVAVLTSVPGQPQNATVNFGRVFIKDPTDPGQLRLADEEGQRQVRDGLRFFRKYVPGMQNVKLLQLARQIGVRESRQIRGLYTLTKEDVVGCRQFADVIAQCWYPIDIHEPGSDKSTMVLLPEGQHYDIPWRCLVPAQGPENLIVAGRCISASHEAMSSLRVSPSVMAIGEAAGVTAALAAATGSPIGQTDVRLVQEGLRANGGILE